MTPFNHENHLLQLDPDSIPEGFIEFGPRDHMVVHVHRFNGAKENVANFAIPARFVRVIQPDSSIPAIEPFDLRETQLSFNDPPPAEGYSVGNAEVRDFGEAVIADAKVNKARNEAEMKAVRDDMGFDQS